MTPQIFIDLSEWETRKDVNQAHAPFDWVTFMGAGGSGATLKATGCGGWPNYKPFTDPQFIQNVGDWEALVQSLLSGNSTPPTLVPYHVSSMRAGTAKTELQYFLLACAAFDTKPARVMLDFGEKDGNITSKDVLTFLDGCADATNELPWLYGNPGKIRQYLPVTETSLRRFPLVVANYDVAAPLALGPWLPMDIVAWQVSQRYYAPAWGVANGNKQCALYQVAQ